MTIKEGVTFLRDGSATIEMLRETIKIIRGFEAKNPIRYKIIVGPMDMVSFLLCSIMILLCFALM